MAVPRTDFDLRREVADALNADLRLDASNVGVDVIDGVVYLYGIVPTLYQKGVADEIAGRIRGVAGVVDRLRVAPVPPRTDQDITTDVRAALSRDPLVDPTRIRVTTRGGVLHLSGIVDSYAQRSAAEWDARHVLGVVTVVDNIEVQPPVARPDAAIAEDVRASLAADTRIDSTRISVEARDAVVYLRGSVPTLEQRKLAEEDAWWVPGVRSVVNDLAIAP